MGGNPSPDYRNEIAAMINVAMNPQITVRQNVFELIIDTPVSQKACLSCNRSSKASDHESYKSLGHTEI